MKFIDLQKTIHDIFNITQVYRFNDELLKEKNGYNWVLSFYDMRSESTIVAYTKFIFKLDDKQENIRISEFLYLKNIPYLYKIIKYDSLGDLTNIINHILNQNLFGDNTLYLSEFLIEPERNINDYFYKNEIKGYTIFDFQYLPDTKSKEFKILFKININNNIDVEVLLKYDDNFKFIFKYNNDIKHLTINKLEKFDEIIGKYIIENIEQI